LTPILQFFSGIEGFFFLLVSFLASEKSTRIGDYEPPGKYVMKYRNFSGIKFNKV